MSSPEQREGRALSRRSFLVRSLMVGAAGYALPAASALGIRPQGAGVGSQGAEILHNGIGLPAQWPPAGMSPESAAPMPVPYLLDPPKVIPVKLGRQLFVDDFLVSKCTLERRFHQPSIAGSGPVLSPETPDELNSTGLEGDERAVCYLGHGGVFFDPKDGLFKMFYTAGWRGGLALATSKDMIRWARPQLGLSRGNLILEPGIEKAGGDNSVWLDLNADDPASRYKMLVQRGRVRQRGPFRHSLHTSPDGLTWSAGELTGDDTPASDYCSIFHNPYRGKWVYSIKVNGPRGRCRHYAEHGDLSAGMKAWPQSVYWVNADERDIPDPSVGDQPQLYSLNAVAYENLHVGMFYIHRGPHNRICEEGRFPKFTDLALGFSRDGFHWHRPCREPFLAGTRSDGDWNRAYLHGTTGVFTLYKDRLYFPFTGYSGRTDDGHRGMYTGASIGMATLRRDGFASMRAGPRGGYLVTRRLVFDDPCLFVNVECPLGVLKVGVLDAQGNEISGYGVKDCLPISVDSTRVRIKWQDHEDLRSFVGRDVRFLFRLENGGLYSFWLSAGDGGESGGYVAAGGPCFAGNRDLPPGSIA